MTTDPDTHAAIRQVPVRLQSNEYAALKAFAHFTARSMNDIISDAVRRYLAVEGRSEQFNAMASRAQRDYALALDKLKDL